MKKILLTTLCAFFCLYGMAQTEKTYNETYVVTANGAVTNSDDTEITIVDNGNGTITFVLKNFVVSIGGVDTEVGDISLENVPASEGVDGLTHFAQEDFFTIPADKLPGQFQAMAFMFENIPYTLTGKMNDVKLYAVINIDMSAMGQSINVVVGTDNFGSQNSKVYTEPLVVTVNGESSVPQMTDVTVVDNGDGTINFVLKNFFMNMGGNEAPVGNIIVNNLPVTEGEDGLSHISYNGTIVIEEGDMEGVGVWIGPMICKDEEGNIVGIPVDLNGKMNDEKLYVTIDIDLSNVMNQVVYVQLGTDDFSAPEGKVYTEPLVVTVNGESSDPQMTDVTVVDNGDGTINFVLKNFFMSMGGNEVPVGNIIVNNLPVTEGEDGLSHISYNGTIVITEGDTEGVVTWIGPMIGQIPVVLNGKMNDEKLFVTIDIDLRDVMNQVVYVQLGTDDFVVAVKGDVNGDGKVDGLDAQTVLNIMSDNTYKDECDVNKDGKVDGIDYQFILNTMSDQ